MLRVVLAVTASIALLLTLLPPSHSPPQNSLGNVDEVFQNLSNRIPGFAGFHYRNGTLVISLARQAEGLQSTEIQSLFNTLTEAQITDVLSNLAEGQYILERVRYSFIQLARWRELVMARTDLMGLWTALDIDEVNNRLFIGVASPENAQTVSNVLESMEIPRDGYTIQPLAVEPLPQLRDYVRPVVGGLQIAFSNYVCTLGFNAIRYGVPGFVTNDHCTNVMGQVEGTNHYQPWVAPGNLIGVETVDPPFFTGGQCPAGYRCRYSDAAFSTYQSGVSYSLGKIARTAGLGSLDIVGEWTIVSEASTVAGQTLNKVGRTTGWTQGQVTNTCVLTYVLNTDVVRICQHFVQAGVNPGDSGSPVFRIADPAAYTVELHGILWGGSGGTLFVFSPISNIEQELGPLETFPQTSVITVLSPNGGENWLIGTTQTIEWTTQNLVGNVDILLSRDGGSTWTTLFTNTANDGSQLWTVTGPPTTTAKIRIRGTADPATYDDSDGHFTVGFTLTVMYPNGGEIWQVGENRPITWSSQPYGTVRILISRDGGASWQTIISSTPNDGSQTWLVSGPQTDTALIRIESNEHPAATDTSDSWFSIMADTSPPSVRVVRPNGGESLKAGRTYTVRWSASGPSGIQLVVIEFSTDGGASWQVIATLNGNPGFYRWKVPRETTQQALIRITVYDFAGNQNQDQSDAFFRIRR